MAEVTVRDLASQVGGIPYEKLIEQLNRAGVSVSNPEDVVTEEDRQKLLLSLKREHGEESTAPKKISLKRKSTTELKVKRASGRTATVEVVKKRLHTYNRKQAILERGKEYKEESLSDFAENLTEKATESGNLSETPMNESSPSVMDAEGAASVIVSHGAGESILSESVSESFVSVEVEAVPSETVPKPSSSTGESPLAQPGATAAPEATKDTSGEKARKKSKSRKKGRGEDGDLDDEREGGSKKKGGGKPRDLEENGRAGRRKTKSKTRSSVQKSALRGAPSKEEIFNPHAFEKPTKPMIHEVKIPETMTVAELAKKMSVKAAEVIKQLMSLGVMATINQVIDQDTACLVVEEMGHRPIPLKEVAAEEKLTIEYTGEFVNRAPVVTVMGHVDHGKTSLLDAIRRTRVTSSEAGGITQHIGAYSVQTNRGPVTFLDTPGHSAFTAMRARGAQCTDIVVLVVAADDGVMPQTVEAIQHAKAAEVPIVVAVNKIDKPEADFDRVVTALTQYGLLPESWGGDTMFVKVSAKQEQGIDDLLEAIMLQSEILELKEPIEGAAQGVVIEAKLDRGRGAVATFLVQRGTLRKGDMILAGLEYGRVRTLYNDRGESVECAGPSTPVEVVGLSGTPAAGDTFMVVSDERKAREVALFRQIKHRDLKLSRQQASKLEGFMTRMQQSDVKALNIVLKADVQGSLEALSEALQELSNSEIEVKVISKGVGGFNESDIHLAMASEAILIGFNVRAEAMARRLLQQEGLQIHYYSIIYDVIDGVKQAMEGRMGTTIQERIIGLAEVRSVFRSSKWGAIAGCMVIDGNIKRGNPIRVLRDNVVIYEGELESLRRFKDNVNEVRNGMECGIGVKNYNDIKEGDQIEVYERVEVSRSELING